MTARTKDLVLDAPDVVEVADDLILDAPIIPPALVAIDDVRLDGETRLQTVRRLLDERKRARLTEKWGEQWHRKVQLVNEKLPVAK